MNFQRTETQIPLAASWLFYWHPDWI